MFWMFLILDRSQSSRLMATRNQSTAPFVTYYTRPALNFRCETARTRIPKNAQRLPDLPALNRGCLTHVVNKSAGLVIRSGLLVAHLFLVTVRFVSTKDWKSLVLKIWSVSAIISINKKLTDYRNCNFHDFYGKRLMMVDDIIEI